MWANPYVLHTAINDYASYRRVMYRTTIEGPPVQAAPPEAWTARPKARPPDGACARCARGLGRSQPTRRPRYRSPRRHLRLRIRRRPEPAIQNGNPGRKPRPHWEGTMTIGLTRRQALAGARRPALLAGARPGLAADQEAQRAVPSRASALPHDRRRRRPDAAVARGERRRDRLDDLRHRRAAGPPVPRGEPRHDRLRRRPISSTAARRRTSRRCCSRSTTTGQDCRSRTFDDIAPGLVKAMTIDGKLIGVPVRTRHHRRCSTTRRCSRSAASRRRRRRLEELVDQAKQLTFRAERRAGRSPAWCWRANCRSSR